MNHYDVLEVSRSASAEVIRAAYRSLMQRFHPDKNPGDQAVGARAAAIAAAYEVLSDADRRAEYDKQLQMAQSQAQAVQAQRHVERPSHRSVADRTPARATGAGLGAWWWVLPVMAAAAIGVFASLKPRKADPVSELAVIRQAFVSKTGSEAHRRELYARKMELLERNPQVMRLASAEKSEDMAARTFVLLEGKTLVKVGHERDASRAASASAAPATRGELTLHGVSLLVGSFEAAEMLALMEGRRERLVRDLMARFAKEDLDRFSGPDRETHLKFVVKQSVADTLGTDPLKDYPSSYFESPGRNGVVEVLLTGQLPLPAPEPRADQASTVKSEIN